MKSVLPTLVLIGTLFTSNVSSAQVAENLSIAQLLNALQIAHAESGQVISSSLSESTFPATALELNTRGFQAVHTYTSLSKVIDYYWGKLTGLGFEDTVVQVNGETVIHMFENGATRLQVVFFQQGEEIRVVASVI